MIDIHCHILPAVDDGSGNWSDSLEMARLAQLSKVSAIVATPHCHLPGNQVNAWTAQLEETLETLRAALRRARVPVALYPGQELFLARGALELLRSGGVIGLNRSRYLLVEFDMEESGRTAYRKLRQVAAEGYVPVVAHPERYGFVQEDDSAEFRLKEAGARVIPIFSFNAWSLDTRFFPAEEVRRRMAEATGEEPLHTLQAVEPFGPQKLLDLLVIAPCTGNTLANADKGIFIL